MTAGLWGWVGVGWVIWEEKSGGKTGASSEKATRRSLKEEGAEKKSLCSYMVKTARNAETFQKLVIFRKKVFLSCLVHVQQQVYIRSRFNFL
jgi:hypothetical protein